jgi:hypothetical protein
MSQLFAEFLYPMAAGVVIVFALLISIRLGLPRRSEVVAERRHTR